MVVAKRGIKEHVWKPSGRKLLIKKSHDLKTGLSWIPPGFAFSLRNLDHILPGCSHFLPWARHFLSNPRLPVQSISPTRCLTFKYKNIEDTLSLAFTANCFFYMGFVTFYGCKCLHNPRFLAEISIRNDNWSQVQKKEVNRSLLGIHQSDTSWTAVQITGLMERKAHASVDQLLFITQESS